MANRTLDQNLWVKAVKRPDLLVLIAVWMFIDAVLAIIGISAIAVFAIPDTGDRGAIFGLSIAILLLLCSLGINVAGGIGLLQGKAWGRILGIVHAALAVIWFPVGTILGVLALVYLTKSEVREYFEGSTQ
jgi:hypothetical protein